jgi:hypothetical protein
MALTVDVVARPVLAPIEKTTPACRSVEESLAVQVKSAKSVILPKPLQNFCLVGRLANDCVSVGFGLAKLLFQLLEGP